MKLKKENINKKRKKKVQLKKDLAYYKITQMCGPDIDTRV